MSFDGLIFDLDGTLWDSTDGIVATWNELLAEYPEVEKVVTSADLAANFGLPLEQIAANMFPDLPHEKRMFLMDQCCLRENDYLAAHGGKLFENELETLVKLAAGWKLFIVSNCQVGYIESFYAGNGTGEYFLDQECAEATGLSKGQNIRLVMKRNQLKNVVFIGDTQGDADAAREAGIPFIYAAYGFGEVDGYDAKLERLKDLPGLLESM